MENIIVHHVQYDSTHLHEERLNNRKDLSRFQTNADAVNWLDIRGLHDSQFIESFGQHMHIHPLILEDIADTSQRPKFEEDENGVFLVIRLLSFNKKVGEVQSEQMSFYFRDRLLLTFQETDSDLLAGIRKRLINSSARVRKRGADYLCYAIADSIIDQNFVVVDGIEEVIEKLEDALITRPDESIKASIHHLKKALFAVRKIMVPMRDTMSAFLKSESHFIREDTYPYLRDAFDHTIQIMEMVETYRDTLNGIQELYISEINLRMNEVMKLLAIVTALFVPLTFIAGIYGMNFQHMPELSYRYGYFIVLAIMLAIFTTSIYYFRKRRWF